MSIESFLKSQWPAERERAMTIGEKVKNQRLNLGLTQEELAQRLEVTIRTISKYETDVVKPRGLNLHKLCTVLGVSEAYLVDPNVTDPAYGLEAAPYVDAVRKEFGPKAGMDMQAMLDGVSTFFAGGDVPQEDKDQFFFAVMEAYRLTKQDAKEKFTPKKYK